MHMNSATTENAGAVFRSWHRDWGGILTIGAACFFLCYLAWMFRLQPSEANKTLVTDLAQPMISLLMTVLAWRTSRRVALGAKNRRAWRTLAVAFLCYFLGNVVWAYYELVLGSDLAVSWADLPYLLYYPICLAGLLSFPMGRAGRSRLTFALDAGTVMLGTTLLIWYVVLRPVGLAEHTSTLETLITMAYPVANTVLLFGVIAVLLRRPARSVSLALRILTMAILADAIADFGYSYQTLHSSYFGGQWPDCFYMLNFVLIAFSAQYQFRSIALTETQVESAWEKLSFRWLPYASVAVAYALLLWVTAKLDPHPGMEPLLWLTIGAFLITALVVARQIIALRDNETLLKEKAASESEARFASLIQYSSDVIAVVGSDGFVGYVSPSVERIFGYRPQDVTGKQLRDFLHPEDRQRVLETTASLAHHPGQTTSLEFQARQGNQSWVDIEATITNLLHVSNVGGLVLNLRNITGRKQADELLHAASNQALQDYGKLVERIALLGQNLGNARDLSIVFRALRDFALVSVPCDGLLITLYDAEAELRKISYCWADEHEFDPSLLPAVLTGNGLTGRAIKSGTVIIQNEFQEEVRSRGLPVVIGDCSEETTPHSALSAPMTVMGRTVGCVEVQSYARDAYRQEHAASMQMAANLAATAVDNVAMIAREQLNEEQLRQSQKMEAIGQLAGGVAHDFNNLLTVISGYSELSLRRVAEGDPLRGYLEQISKAGTRAAGLTRQLLAYSRRQLLQATVLDLNSVVKEMDLMLQRLIGEDIKLVTRMQPALGQIKADAGQIEQVVLNLVVNARDALPQGGMITIESRNATLDETYATKHFSIPAGDYVMLTVSDNGIGMDAQTQEKIFDPFFTTKDVGKGTGLGLSTVYGIIKQSNGNIWVYSEVGKGTTFKVYLPRVDEVAPDQSVSVPGLMPGSETILLVEDEQLVRELTEEMLQECGYLVMTASDGEAGLLLSQQFAGRIDLMITDVVMPRMSGRELAEQVAILRPETRVLFMSGYTDDSIVRHGILEEDVAFLQKPFSPELLAAKARELLDQAVLVPA
ncbi:MAG: two-component system, cell cycle sensor histidine kinase and response regulator CckA [Pyrinomonadaceae bacterium]|nr:two-component system, cell cycle sensor histidine kinase and response regulator CckA [Pyrinomonadaceae bacterium]